MNQEFKDLLNSLSLLTNQINHAYNTLSDEEKHDKKYVNPLTKQLQAVCLTFEKTFNLKNKVEQQKKQLEMQEMQIKKQKENVEENLKKQIDSQIKQIEGEK